MSFEEAGSRILEGVAAGLYEATTVIMAQSQALVPVETGTLKRSGVVEQPTLTDGGDSMTVTVGYGYGAAYETRAEGDGDEKIGRGYGYWVHERVVTRTGDVVYHKPPTQAKFLKTPAELMKPEFPAIIEANVRMRLGDG